MKLGIFDSGLGGLLVTRALVTALPEYDYVYLGDTKRVPYGGRSQETIYEYVREAVEWLFSQDCSLVLLACNTASAEALRRIQQEFLPAFPGRRVLGVIIPTAEAVAGASRAGVLATRSTVASGTYLKEIGKVDPAVQVIQNAAPLLVPLIENQGETWAPPIIESYLTPLREAGIDRLILGCTHYSAYKEIIRAAMPGVEVICQDELIPPKLAQYLAAHPEVDAALSRGGGREYFLTELTTWAADLGQEWAGGDVSFAIARL